jgi:hypothetical protein
MKAHVVSVCFSVSDVSRGMLQKWIGDVAHVASVSEVLFKMFYLFQTHVAGIQI